MAAQPASYRLACRREKHHLAPGRAGLLAAVPAVDRRRRQAPLAPPAARRTASTPPTPTPGSSRSARDCGRSSPSTAGRSRRGSSSACADGRWRYATYVWKADGSDAVLAPARGHCRPCRWPRAPGGRYAIPSRGDCLACHDERPVPVLGVSALQLSPDRDPLGAAPAGADLSELLRRGLLRGLPQALLERRRASPRPRRGTRRARLPARQLRPLPQRQRRRRAGAR